ncbi:alpha/beta fold hydrolase [Amycolatopsis australiensis]|uniref:Pimeloyl-ACP methyl ester carboxylesterase n=1 Tax=Amycolatopsis australiensis TaxID=546364 RepID=A0A1K1RP30_9PSEU|nr:alpha/beta hydrolase [Amycolatopsis australiensis]SFW73790.1 Pimeloyl-ACP methyl ester carboxylesterase [Amycolatopsis australiensis]
MPHLNVNGTRLHYEDAGTGPALLFVHGWGTSGRVWQSCLPDLVRDHRVVTLDWRGCGRSDHPADGTTIAGITADLAAVAETLAIKPTVVGSSIGGVFATELALARPELVERVVAVDSPGYWPSAGMLDKVLDLRKRLVDDRAGTLEGWVPNWFAPGTAPGLVAWTVRQLLDSGVYIDELFTECTTYDPRPRLKDLTVPITYVHGELDAEIPLEVPRACAAETPGARVHVLAGCGHVPHQENPRAFTATLRTLTA